MNSLTRWLGLVGAAAGIGTLGIVLYGLWRGTRRPKGRSTGLAKWMLRWPVYLIIGILFFGTCFFLWRPLPFSLTPMTNILMLVFGALLYFSGLTLVLWGRITLGKMYDVSSSLGAHLYADHQLVTQGPFAFVRHPMYLGIMAASVGGLFIYRTWTFVFLAIVFLGLVVRAKREEQVMAAEFGEQWERYCQQVPGWIPRVWRRDHKTTVESSEKEP